jgi:copper chaperone CopZ
MSIEDKLIDFMNSTSNVLGRIETIQVAAAEDINRIKIQIEKVPVIETNQGIIKGNVQEIKAQVSKVPVIETNQGIIKGNVEDIKIQVEKIPLIELGLSNHLSSHSRLKKYFIWPITVSSILLVVSAVFKFFRIL